MAADIAALDETERVSWHGTSAIVEGAKAQARRKTQLANEAKLEEELSQAGDAAEIAARCGGDCLRSRDCGRDGRGARAEQRELWILVGGSSDLYSTLRASQAMGRVEARIAPQLLHAG